MASNETIIFNGIRFRRYPESERRSDRVYYTPGVSDKQRGIGRLHQEIWKAANGPIPDGYHVHHSDHDPLNNDLSNLVLLDADEHLRYHGNDPRHTETLRSVQSRGQEAAKAWHRSEEGRAWHREHAKNVWGDRPNVAFVCEHCGVPFQTLATGRNRFCSNKCRHYARKASGVDNVDKTCECCGETYTADRYAKALTCSRSCGMRMARRRTRERLAAE